MASKKTKRKKTKNIWTVNEFICMLESMNMDQFAFDFDSRTGEFIIYTGLMAGDKPNTLVEPK